MNYANKETIIQYIHQTDNIDLISDVELNESDDYFSFQCELFPRGESLKVKLLVPKRFPMELPRIYLSRFDELGFLPHIEPKGSVCYLEKESVYTNVEEPLIVFQASVELAIQTIIDGLEGTNKDDFREEFNAFWDRNESISDLLIASFVEIGDTVKKIQILKDNKRAVIYEFGANIDRQKNVFLDKKKTLTKSGIYIPIISDCEVIPPKFNEKWSVNELIKWLKPKISDSNWKLLTESILTKNPSKFEYLVIAIPRTTGPELLIGIQFRPKENTGHPLLSENTGWGLNFLKIQRYDQQAIFPRGGADVNLRTKSILLIGCGSVGSHVAVELAKAGSGLIGLVDHDILKIENIQRFAIGLQYLFKGKVGALKDYLEQNYFSVHIFPFQDRFENLLENNKLPIEKSDLVISAIGEPTLNFYLSKFCKDENIPFIIGWNEPYGIGGHAILSLPHQKGCYRCLYKENYNIASFAAMDQPKPFHKKHLSCGEVYTPYSALDSIRTSELMVRLAANLLTGKCKESEILSWKGDSSEFINQGFNLSSRYLNQNPDDFLKHKSDFINEDCPYCSNVK